LPEKILYFEDVLGLLDQSLPEEALLSLPTPFDFRHDIRFESVRFRYSLDGPLVRDGVNLIIPEAAGSVLREAQGAVKAPPWICWVNQRKSASQF